MRKPTSRLLGVLMVLAMVLTMLPASVFAAGETENPVKDWNLTLGDNIGVNFHIAIDEADVAQTSVSMTVAGNTVTVDAEDAPKKDGCYVFTVEVAAAQMTDVITLAMVTAGEQVYSGTYSVRDYAMQIMNGQYDKEIKEMVSSMLHYGAAAQTYFTYNTDNLANAFIDAAASVQVPTSLEGGASLEGSVADLFCYGTSLVFQSNIAVRFYFRGTGDIANYTFTVDGVPYTPVPKDVMYYVEVQDINPAQLADVVSVVVNDGQSDLTVSYSPLQYIVNKCNGNPSGPLKALLTAMYAYHLEAKEYVVWDAIEPATVEGGVMANHGNGKTDTGMYFTMAANDAPHNSDWTLEYTQTSADAVKLIRNGETTSIGIVGRPLFLKYSDTEYYLKLEAWTLGDYAAITESDVLVIEGDFYYSGTKTTLNISKSYIYHDGSAWVISNILPTTYELGNLIAHPDSNNNWNTGGVYMAAADNDAPYNSDWSFEYAPTSSSVIKRIRDGVTIDVAIAGRGTLVKYSETEFYMNINSWTMGENQPAQDGDVYIIEGDFYNEATKATINISKTYVYFNGSDAEFSTEMPTLPATVDAGVMSKHTVNGWASNGVYGVMAENAAPYDGWSVEYTPVAAENLKLIRNGETFSIGIPGRGTLVKYSATEYFLKMEWNVGDYAPMQDGDILIVEGSFINETSKVTLNIAKTYIQAKGDTVVFSTTEPVQTTIVEGGNMTAHADGWDASDGVYFTLAENAVPVDENAELAYTAESGVIKLVRGGTTYEMAGAVIKYGSTDYYLTLSGSSHLPLQNNDYLIVEGAFANEDNRYILNISKTYILVDGDNVAFSTTEPVLKSEHVVTIAGAHSNGWTADGIYMTTNAHEATYNSNWSVEYKPVSADVIKLIRNGQTISVGIPESGTLVVYSQTDVYFKTAAWTIANSVLPLVDGDMLVIEGKFVHEASNTYIAVGKTVICVDGSSLIYNPVMADRLTNHPNGAGGDGVYANMNANAAPYNTDWTVEYSPVSADDYKVIRDGVETSIGQPGRGTMVKFSETEYYLKTSGWCLNGFTATTSDVFIIDGYWKNTADGTVIKMAKTYLYHNGSAWVFSATLPSVVSGGVMQTHGNGMSGSGIYFSMDANAAPYNTDWTLEYAQTSVDGIKLIRNGETISIGIVGRPLIIKTSEVQYYLKLEGWTIGEYGLDKSSPITTEDVLIIEGNFEYAAQNVTLNITKSYVYYDGIAWVCSAEAPAQKNVVDITDLSSHGNGWTASGGLTFIAAANDAPYDTDWSLRYTPTSTSVIKLTRNGTTTNIASTGAEMIVKYSETEYYMEFWPISLKPMQAGDVMTVEGEFYNAANDTYINIEKTYITFNADGSASYIAENDKYINAGAMSAYSSNWFGSGIYFAMDDNIAPAAEDWTVRYMPKSAANIKLVRDGVTYDIGNTGAETIVKIADGWYWLSLENWWWNSYAPIVDGDVLIVEGAFTNASNGYTLNIDKTYITFVSQENDDVVFSVAADTQFGEVLLPNTNKTLTIGMWNGSHHVFNNARLAELQAAGITKIIGIDPQWIGSENNWDMNYLLDRMQNYGISVVAYARQRTADGTQYSGDDWDGETVPDYANHPALIGFLMYDEPSATEFDALAELKTKFDAVMPEGKLFYVNLFPSCAAGTSLVGALDWALGHRDYDTYYVQKFLDKLDVEVLSWDNYSLLEGNGIRTDYYRNFEVMAGKNVPMWYTMLTSGHGTTSASYATPTAAELRWQMAVAMTYGVQNIDHYVYTSHEADYSTMLDYSTETVTDLYYDVKDVDNEYLAWDNIFMSYTWKGVAGVKAESSSTMLDQLQNNISLADNGLASVSASEDLLVGVFDYNGDKAYMITNAGSAGSTTVGDGKNLTMTDTTVTLTLDAADYKCAAVIDQGKITYVAVENNTVTINVEAYEGVFVIPVLN